MDIEEAKRAVAVEENVPPVGLQKIIDSAFESDAQRRATAQAALRAIDHGVDILRRFGIELEVQLIERKVESKPAMEMNRQVGRNFAERKSASKSEK